MHRLNLWHLAPIVVGILAVLAPSYAHAEDGVPTRASGFEDADCWFENPIPFLPQPDFECGYVSVPERHDDPRSPMIRLPVAILRTTAEDPRPDPLFVAQGGPGGDAFEVFTVLLGSQAESLGRDIVIFNQRGAPYAEPSLMCPESADATEEVLSLPGKAADERSLEALSDCYERLSQDGIDLSAYNSVENAADVEVIRQVLGYDEYNFYGVSYGTLLGLHLMRNHPQYLRSVILDGVVPTDLNFIPYVASSTDRVFGEIIRFCEEDSACSAEYPNLEQRFFNLVDELNQNPERITIKDSEAGKRVEARLDGDTLVDVLFQAFYLPDAYAIFPKVVDNLEDGDFTFIRAMWPYFAFNRSVSEGMYFSVICAEDADFTPSDVSLEGIRPYFASVAEDDMQTYIDACAIWNVDRLPAEVNEPVHSDIPTLLLSGKYDPITPPLFAAVAEANLENGYSFVSPTGSHGVAFEDECMTDIVKQFLESPEIRPEGSCLEKAVPAEIVHDNVISFPFLGEINQLTTSMWIQLGAASLFLMGILSSYVVLPVFWLIGKLRKKDPLPKLFNVKTRRLKWINGLLALLFGFLAVLFVSGAAFFTLQALLNGMANIFSISAAATPFFVIPLILSIVAAVMLVIAFKSWRRKMWSTGIRLYYSFLALCAVGYVVVLAMGGMMTVLL